MPSKLFIALATWLVAVGTAMRIHRPIDLQTACNQIVNPHWPFAYSKFLDQDMEWKGRVASNWMNFGHICTTRGTQSKCNRCAAFNCLSTTGTCPFQIQGAEWQTLAKNIPSVTDTPWAVSGSHRNDFGGASTSHVCVTISGGECLMPWRPIDYKACKLRCWGHHTLPLPAPIPPDTIVKQVEVALSTQFPDPMIQRDETVAWSTSVMVGHPQGIATLTAGIPGQAGHLDGPWNTAMFHNPVAIAVDHDRNLYVADSGNHCIRMIRASDRTVVTIAGVATTRGFKEGAGNVALFDNPSGITLYYDWVDALDQSGEVMNDAQGALTILVSDSGNHRIRKIERVGSSDDSSSFLVSTLAGRKGLSPLSGYADGGPRDAKFEYPLGIAATSDGLVYVADSGNHLVRRVEPNGEVFTLAGRLQPDLDPDCAPPCLVGVPGFQDGNLTFAQLSYPTDVAVTDENTVLVVDQHRIRRVARIGNNDIPVQAQVSTLAGSDEHGEADGSRKEASFHSPSGIAVSSNGIAYVGDTVNCRIRRLTSATQIALPVTCTTRAIDIISPSGCQSYNEPVDGMDLKVTDARGFIHYNHALLDDGVEIPFKYGHRFHRCQGTPPPEHGYSSSGDTLGSRNGTGYVALSHSEDTGYQTLLRVNCPASCATHSSVHRVIGTGRYTDDSLICKSAVHNGTLTDAGGIVTVQLLRSDDEYVGSTQNGVTSLTATRQAEYRTRGFRVITYPDTEVHTDTIYGKPAAPLESACGFEEGNLPYATAFNLPRGVAVYVNASLTNTEKLYIADSGNHIIREATAMCTQVCENGGQCTAPDTCSCATGWAGHDCTEPVCTPGSCNGIRNMCVGPNQCECVPGFAGFPLCNVPLCVQQCENGGSCVAPDTCDCATGWFGPSCTIPVCSMTCGNNANCVAPDTCDCPLHWTGVDCRTPVCTQPCLNGGTCSAPDTCLCPAEWSGHDCSLPVCDQGFLASEDSSPGAGSERKAIRSSHSLLRNWNHHAIPPEEADGSVWRQYVPCNFHQWCRETNGFDCEQQDRASSIILEPMQGEEWLNVTGLGSFPGTLDNTLSNNCVRIELALGTRSPFSYEQESSDANFTSSWRVQPPFPYGWDSWANGPDTYVQAIAGVNGWRSAVESTSDRMVAAVELRAVKQGKYVCANGGECVAPGTCSCQPGWTGFDCRTPICEQGYFEPSLDEYQCSIRSFTEWEQPGYIHNHPNYYSRYMDHHQGEWSPENRTQLEDERPHYWDNMGWPAVHHHTDPLGNDTTRGWTRNGYWEVVPGTSWTKGKCKVEFYRHCPESPVKSRDIRTLLTNSLVEDTEAAFRASVLHSDKSTIASGRWSVLGGECIDQVMRGCRNNGTCVAPNTCECAPGWTGHDCTIPVCEQECSRPDDDDLGVDNNGNRIRYRGKGNCTLPNTCTCEKGWTGHDCSVALCAQTCGNDGRCTLPDTCTCARWESTYRDGRQGGGRPLYRTSTGDPQLTGWTGYDCATPICTQAKQFVHNNRLGSSQLGGYGLILFGQEPMTNIFRPDLKNPPYYPFIWSNDIPPIEIYLPVLREYNKAIWDAESDNMLESSYRLCRMKGRLDCDRNPDQSPLLSTWGRGDGEVTRNNGRSFQFGCKRESPRFSDNGIGSLCNVIDWEQGDYDDGRTLRFSADATSFVKSDESEWQIDYSIYAGEGIYECYNQGSCVAPDMCSCPDGYQGFDCSVPLCRHRQVDGQVVSCVNNGVCESKDTCSCEQRPSILHLTYPGTPKRNTGWEGSDCSIAICAQGTFDPDCTGISAGGEGCYRCKNGGFCTAPDFCSCPSGWTGHDCGTPVCTVRVDEETVAQLDTGSVEKVREFERDPCQTSKKLMWGGIEYGQGNCTGPGFCTCLCMEHSYLVDGEWVELPWQDPLERSLPLGSTYGSKRCKVGFEGMTNTNGSFNSCHLRIYTPAWWEEYSKTLIGVSIFLGVVILIAYLTVRRRMRQRYLLEKAARRRSVLDHDFDDKFS